MPKIHPTAVVDKKAKLAADVEVGPYSVIGPDVVIGKGTVIRGHVTIEGHTVIGERNEIWHGASIGTPAQVRHYRRLKTAGLTIGDDNIIREAVTINAASEDQARTLVGSRNFFMMSSHVAHDCVVGNDVTLANIVMIGGHVVVEDQATIGGLAGVHQHVRIGKLAMVGGVSRVLMDVPPYAMSAGQPARIYGVNAVGLRRAGYKPAQRTAIKRAMKLLFHSGLRLVEAVERARREFAADPDVEHLLRFVEATKRGIARQLTPTAAEADAEEV